MREERIKIACFWIAFILATVFFTFQAEAAQAGAARIRVSQESSPGAEDFGGNILGVIESFVECGKSAAQSYAYDGSVNYYRGTTITPQTNTSHLFVVHTSTGLALFVVHDAPGVPNGGGRAEMRFELSGDPDGAAILVRDDPSADDSRDVYSGDSGASVFTSKHTWDSSPTTGSTDGLVIGTLEGDWSAGSGMRKAGTDTSGEIFKTMRSLP
jgi:hypothetical protein